MPVGHAGHTLQVVLAQRFQLFLLLRFCRRFFLQGFGFQRFLAFRFQHLLFARQFLFFQLFLRQLLFGGFLLRRELVGFPLVSRLFLRSLFCGRFLLGLFAQLALFQFAGRLFLRLLLLACQCDFGIARGGVWHGRRGWRPSR